MRLAYFYEHVAVLLLTVIQDASKLPENMLIVDQIQVICQSDARSFDIVTRNHYQWIFGQTRRARYTKGKPTLPLIIAYAKSTPEEQAIMSERFADPNTTLQDLMPYIEKTNAINDALQEAHAASLLAENCLNMLPDTPYKQAMYDLVTFAISRTH